MLSDRIKSITPSYTIGISTKVLEMKRSGINVIDLSIGEPDFNVPENAKNGGIDSLNKNFTKYNKVPGLDILREKICHKLLNENNCNYSPDEIVVSNGAKHAITNTLLALVNPNDDIIVPRPYWVSYPEMIKLINANPIFIDTEKANNFKITAKEISNNITPKTKLLILNNPCNPTGSVYTKEELSEIVDVCYKNNIYILADEIYEKICFDNKFISIASLSDKSKDITITINGFSKSIAMTGLRLGYSASNQSISKAISTIQGHLTSHPSLTSQYIGYSALNSCSKDIDSMVNKYKYRRNLVCNKIKSIPYIDYIYPNGAFYFFIDISSFKSHFNYTNSFSIEFCNELLNKHNVAVVPGIAFGMDDFIRISFACSDKSLMDGLDKLNIFINDIINI